MKISVTRRIEMDGKVAEDSVSAEFEDERVYMDPFDLNSGISAPSEHEAANRIARALFESMSAGIQSQSQA